MKKSRKVSGRLLAALLSVLAVGCTVHGEEAAGGSLELWLSDYEQEVFQGAIEEFQETYPEVEMNITAYSSAGSVIDTMRRMQTQLMGGDGPDLLLFSCYGTDDVYKLMKAEIFAPLDSLMEADETWNPEEYVMPVVEGGSFDGTQYVMPLTYCTTVALASEETLQERGFSVENCGDTLGFMKETAKLYDTDDSDRVLEDVGFSQFAMYLGGDFLDYQTGNIGIDGQVLKEACESYAPMAEECIHYAGMPESGYPGFGRNLAEGRSCLYVTGTLYNLLAGAAAISVTDTPLLLPLYTSEGEVTADIRLYAGIRANSENQENAWNMLRLMLKEETQQNMAKRMMQLPVSRGAFDEMIQELADEAVADAKSSVGDGRLSEEFLEEYRKYALAPDRCVFITQMCVSDFYTYMEPFYCGEESYEDCLSRFESYAKIYLTE